MIEIPLKLDAFSQKAVEREIFSGVETCRKTAQELLGEEREMDALERIVAGMRLLREFPDYDNIEFRAMLVALLFDLSEIHFKLKDYKQSEKELEMIFKVLEQLVKSDEERFGKYHILAMEQSTRVLRSRKKTMEMLVKQKLAVDALYEKVNSGVLAATDRLVDSLRNAGQYLASAGDYREALKFFSEAIRLSKKRNGKITRKEVKMTIEMAEIMMRVRPMRPRARRLLNAILPHAISLETIELEEDILALVEMIDNESDGETRWKNFVHKITHRILRKPHAGSQDTEEGAGSSESGKPAETEEKK